MSQRKTRNILEDEEAQVGIGTMIVFIATVLVAAIAAGVLIDTAGKLQDRSSRTGSEATEEVSSNLDIDSLVGTRDASTDAGLKNMEVYVTLSPGASDVDLEQLKIQLNDGQNFTTLDYATAAASTNFTAEAIRDADSSFSASTPVMTAGDLVKITIDLDATSGANMEFTPRTDVSITLLPEVGNSVSTGFTTPTSYGTSLVVELS